MADPEESTVVFVTDPVADSVANVDAIAPATNLFNPITLKNSKKFKLGVLSPEDRKTEKGPTNAKTLRAPKTPKAPKDTSTDPGYVTPKKSKTINIDPVSPKTSMKSGPVTPKTPKTPRSRPSTRVITRWTPEQNEALILGIDKVLREQQLKALWRNIAEKVDTTPGAIEQHIAKMRKRHEEGTTTPYKARRRNAEVLDATTAPAQNSTPAIAAPARNKVPAASIITPTAVSKRTPRKTSMLGRKYVDDDSSFDNDEAGDVSDPDKASDPDGEYGVRADFSGKKRKTMVKGEPPNEDSFGSSESFDTSPLKKTKFNTIVGDAFTDAVGDVDYDEDEDGDDERSVNAVGSINESKATVKQENVEMIALLHATSAEATSSRHATGLIAPHALSQNDTSLASYVAPYGYGKVFQNAPTAQMFQPRYLSNARGSTLGIFHNGTIRPLTQCQGMPANVVGSVPHSASASMPTPTAFTSMPSTSNGRDMMLTSSFHGFQNPKYSWSRNELLDEPISYAESSSTAVNCSNNSSQESSFDAPCPIKRDNTRGMEYPTSINFATMQPGTPSSLGPAFTMALSMEDINNDIAAAFHESGLGMTGSQYSANHASSDFFAHELNLDHGMDPTHALSHFTNATNAFRSNNHSTYSLQEFLHIDDEAEEFVSTFDHGLF